MLGAYKKHPQAYFLYVEDCFLLSDNADAPYISKGLPDFAFFERVHPKIRIGDIFVELMLKRFDNSCVLVL